MSRPNETRHIKWHKHCKFKCRLEESVCNNKQRWNKDKCRCEWHENECKCSSTLYIVLLFNNLYNQLYQPTIICFVYYKYMNHI